MTEITTEAPVVAEASSDDRGAKLRASRAQRMEDYFGGGKTYRVDRPVDLPEGQVFQTPFGNKGRHGYILVRQENGQDVVKEDGKPDACVFGITVIRKAAEMYPGAVEVPAVSKKSAQVTVAVADSDQMTSGEHVPEGTPEALQNPSVG